MKVALDATPLLGPRTGVGRYVAGLARALAGLAGPEPESVALVPFSWRGTRDLPAVAPSGPRVRCGRRRVPARLLQAAWARLPWPPVEWSPLFVFHTDRNRLLMLTKNARADLAAREVLRYPLTTASLALREVARSRHTRRRPPVRPTLLRLRVLGSYLRLLPVMLVRRRRIAARATVDRDRLERWLVLR